MPSLKKCSEQIKTQKKNWKFYLIKVHFVGCIVGRSCQSCGTATISWRTTRVNRPTLYVSCRVCSTTHRKVSVCRDVRISSVVKTESRSEQNEQKVCESWLNTKVGKFEIVKTRISMKKIYVTIRMNWIQKLIKKNKLIGNREKIGKYVNKKKVG